MVVREMSCSSTDYKALAQSPLPKTRGENGGRCQLSNGMLRVHRVLNADELAAGRKTRWMELEISGTIKNLSPGLWQLKHLTALFLNGNQLTRIPTQISQLSNLTVLDLSHNKLRSLPAELGDMISLCHLYLGYNQLRVLPYEIGKLFRLQTLGLNGNPLSLEISKLYHDVQGTQKLLQHLLDHLAINTQPPPERQWITFHRVDRDRPIASFTALCYNVLCDKYATSSLYSYCPTWALNWEYRKAAIMKEIRHYDADIITLQEVETEQYRLLFLAELEQAGYSGIFSPKSRAKTMAEDERKYVDGCAIFWKTDKFELEKEHLIEFTRIAIAKAEGNEHMLNRVMTRDNIALAAVLKVKEQIYGANALPPPPSENVAGSPLLVCTAHVHWDPEFCDVKLIQTMMLVDELTKLVGDVGGKWRIPPERVPVMLCGDLNSLPESGVFEYLAKGRIATDHADLKQFRNEAIVKTLGPGATNDYHTHPLRLDSAYENNLLPFTNYTLDFKGVIDYVFSTPTSLCRLGVLGALDPHWFQTNKIIGCPHPHVSSDHIPLLAHYAFIPTQHQRPPPAQAAPGR